MDISGIEALHANMIKADELNKANPELVDASRKFEAIFVRHLLGDALKPMLHATPGSSGPGSSFYQYMFTDAIAKSLSDQEQFGISSLLQMELAGSGTGKSNSKGQLK
jgi:Rod binding domain-containing protein